MKRLGYVGMVIGDDCGASAWGQALQFGLLGSQMELWCCVDCDGITCGADYVVARRSSGVEATEIDRDVVPRAPT